jgi:N-acetyl-alpha-D-muramate 1-phosphate uridylyltransferase
MKAMVLAAGRGERMRPLSDATPKPLLPAGGRPLIGYLLASLARAGVREVVINLSWLGERIRSTLRDGAEFGVQISYTEEGPVPLETGGGIVNALPLLGADPFIVVSGDIWTDFDFRSLRVMAEADAQVVLIPNPAHHPRGDFALQGDRVVAAEQDRLTYANIGLYRREMFSGYAQGRFPLVQALERSIASGRLRGQIHHGEWMNIGTAQQLATLDARLRNGGVRAAP